MGKLIKYFLFLLAGFAVLLVAAVFIAPKFIDVQKYKPLIEEKVAVATGRSVSLGGDLKVSLFPWVGVSLSDFRLGNPKGFEADEFVRVKSFEAHVKVMPLFSKEVQIDSFVLDGPEIYLEKKKNGQANWEGLGSGTVNAPAQKEPPTAESSEGFSLKSIEVGEFSILNGKVTYVDRQQDVQKELSGLTLQLKDVSFERPIDVIFNATIDGKAVAASGSIGPLGKTPGQGVLPLDMTLKAVEQLTVKLKGQLENPAGVLKYDFSVDVDQFSPRKLMSAMEIDFPVITTDPGVLDKVTLGLRVSGGTTAVAITKGKMQFDDSSFDFNANVAAFAPLNFVFAGNLDAIDLDRYLPPKQNSGGATAEAAPEKKTAEKIDYTPLRKLTLDTKVTVGQVKIHGGKLENVQMQLTAKNGLFKISPMSVDLYQGNMSSSAIVNVQGQEPVTEVDMKASAVEVGPLLQDFMKKDILEGTLVSEFSLKMKGDTPESIKKTLNGQGEMIFQDGAIVGIDLAGMVRNAKASFGLAEKTTEKPRTDFAELRAPFTLTNGLFNTPETSLLSPLIRVTVSGSANLVTEALDMRVRPKFVATLKGQGDTEQRSGLMVPVLVTGTFTSPKFSPDLAGLVEGGLPDVETLKKTLEQGIKPEKIVPKEQVESLEKEIKNLINVPGFPFNKK
jgi:AsmA protein